MFYIIPHFEDVEKYRDELYSKYNLGDDKKLFKLEEVRQIIADHQFLINDILWAWKFDVNKVRELTEAINKGIL